MALTARLFQPQDSAQWDAFVGAHPHGSPFHLLAWKRTLERAFRYTSCYLVAEDGRGIRAVLPLFMIQNVIMGRVLISSPFAVYGGILADSGEARDAIKGHLEKLAQEHSVQHVELRNCYPEQCVGFQRISRYVTFTQDTMIADAEELLSALPKKTRNMVRKTQKFAYEVRFSKDISAFYTLMARN